MLNDKIFFDIFSTSELGADQYEGTIHFFTPDLSQEEMLKEASTDRRYPALPFRNNVRFVQQGTPEWNRLMQTFKQ